MSSSLTRKKRAVYTSLYPYLERDNLMRAMILWEDEYSDQPSFAVQHFVNDICSDSDLKSIRRTLLMSLIKTLALPESELMPDPSTRVAAYKKHYKISSGDPVSKDLVIFQKLVSNMLDQVNANVSANIKDYVIDNLAKSTISTLLKQQIQLWLSKQVVSIKAPSPDINDLRMIINFFYVGFCEFTGPVETDRILGRSVATVTDNYSNELSEGMRKLL